MIFFIFLFSVTQQVQSSINISCQNLLQEQASPQDPMQPTALVGRPFRVNIKIDGNSSNKSIDTTQFPRNCAVIRSSRNTSIQMINNQVTSTATHSFDLVPQNDETIILGPISIDGLQSNSITIRVRHPTPSDNKQTTDEDDENSSVDQNTPQPPATVHMQIKADKKNFYAGEPFIVSRLMYHRGDIRKIECEELSSQHAFIKKLPGKRERKEIFEGAEYRVTEEQYLICSTKPGFLVMPAHQFAYLFAPSQQHQRHHHDPFQMFMNNFMQFSLQQQRGIVPETTFSIMPLPDHVDQIDAIGNFSEYSISINPPNLALNETAQITVRIKGFGNFNDIARPHLNLPPSWNTYASTQKMIQEMSVEQKEGIKEFSVVIQPTKAGNFNIPAQTFSFFNPQTKKVVVLKTQPLASVIQGAEIENTDAKNEIKVQEKEKKEDKNLHTITPWNNMLLHEKQMPMIPWYLFIFFLLLTFLILNRKTLLSYCKRSHNKNSDQQLLIELEEALSQQQYRHAHTIIKKIFGLSCKMPETLITESIIEEHLIMRQHKVSEVTMIKDVYINTCIDKSGKIISPDAIKKTILILKNLFIFLFFFPLISMHAATKQNNSIDAAWEQIENNNISIAHQLFIEIPDKKAATLLTLAEIAHAEKKITESFFWYHAAQKKLSLLHPLVHAEIIKQKKTLFNQLNANPTIITTFFFSIENYFISIPVLFWQLLFLLFWIIFLLQIHRNQVTKQMLFYLFCLSIIALPLIISANMHAQEYGLTYANKTTMYSGPDTTYDTVATIPTATKLLILQKEFSFYKIKQGSKIGWVSKKELLLA